MNNLVLFIDARLFRDPSGFLSVIHLTSSPMPQLTGMGNLRVHWQLWLVEQIPLVGTYHSIQKPRVADAPYDYPTTANCYIHIKT
jgi:hypothetical protein